MIHKIRQLAKFANKPQCISKPLLPSIIVLLVRFSTSNREVAFPIPMVAGQIENGFGCPVSNGEIAWMQKSFTLLILLVLASSSSFSQLLLKISSSPTYFTPLVDPIYVAGTFNNWNPADPNWQMTKQPDGSYSIQVTGTPGTLVEYKYVRGQWPRVETNANGSFLPNRSFTFQNGQSILDTVQAWEDLVGPHTVVGNVRLLSMDFPMPQFGRTRRIWVYLPQDYYTTTNSYPVLYMHDGQNLFDETTTAFGTEWAVDEAMEMLQDSGYAPAIIVGIDNGGVDRIDEYTPWANVQYGGGDGAILMDWMVQDLKPFIDNYFRTQPGRLHTGIMGSSLGGLLSLYGLMEHSSTFSKAGVFSPSYWFNDSCFTHAATRTQNLAGPVRIYQLAGGQESGSMVPNTLAMRDTLLAAGLGTANLRTVLKPDGQHSEWFWAREFAEAYKWLFLESSPVGNEDAQKLLPQIVPSVVAGAFRLSPSDMNEESVEIILWDLNGREVQKFIGNPAGTFQLGDLKRGFYCAEIRLGASVYFQRLLRI